MAITRGQKIFFISYPFVHCILSVLAVLMAICTGIFPEPEDPPPTTAQLIVSAVGSKLGYFLMAPIFLLRTWGIRTEGPYTDYIWIFLTGILYGTVFLFMYKKIYKR